MLCRQHLRRQRHRLRQEGSGCIAQHDAWPYLTRDLGSHREDTGSDELDGQAIPSDCNRQEQLHIALLCHKPVQHRVRPTDKY